MDGSVFEADLVVIATGSWTPSAFPDLGLGEKCLATGQCAAMVQLSPKEANAYQSIPVVLAFNTGFYVFPPTENNIMKMAFHRGGYTHTVGGISTPRTLVSAENGLAVPKEILGEFREHFRNAFPELAEKPFSSTRLCWYNDTPDGDWIIGRDPDDPSLMFATGGSGHAFKFLPVIGRVVADVIQGSLSPDLARKFAVNRDFKDIDKSREGFNVPKELIIDQLCVAEDLAV
ncbi:fructosyl amino acid oxidasesarcosine [Moniliophthora roreri MCA 2997]|nr:fructosyl amino acid oxidasesarcosine [Moniliophthora roreri MCA 2997]